MMMVMMMMNMCFGAEIHTNLHTAVPLKKRGLASNDCPSATILSRQELACLSCVFSFMKKKIIFFESQDVQKKKITSEEDFVG